MWLEKLFKNFFSQPNFLKNSLFLSLINVADWKFSKKLKFDTEIFFEIFSKTDRILINTSRSDCKLSEIYLIISPRFITKTDNFSDKNWVSIGFLTGHEKNLNKIISLIISRQISDLNLIKMLHTANAIIQSLQKLPKIWMVL